ncbi:MAG: hypothetical protein P8Y00_05885 [Deltaproteobacteria bacterium]
MKATFRRDHLDLPPLGDMGGCITVLIAGHPEVELRYSHRVNGEEFYFDTRDIKKDLEDVAIHEPKILKYLGGMIRKAEARLRAMT